MLFIDMAIISAGATLVGSLILVGAKAKKEYDDEKIATQKKYNETRIEEYEMRIKEVELQNKLKQAERNSNKANKGTEGLF